MTNPTAIPPMPSRDSLQPDREIRVFGFTIVELLVVISIISVLAALTVGLAGLATRKGKEARLRSEMTKLTTAIENYKTSLGYYPPDHRISDTVSVPFPNQLYYELSGTVFTNNQFVVPGQQEGLPTATVATAFGTSTYPCPGFSNSARDARDLKFTEELKATQVQRIPYNGASINILAVPVRGPTNRIVMVGSLAVNPWLYISTSPTNNPDRYDLWTEVVLGKNIVRISNWEKDPTPLPPVP